MAEQAEDAAQRADGDSTPEVLPAAVPASAPARSRRPDAIALLLCALAGFLLATYPHLHEAWTHGDVAFVADPDEHALYLPVAADAYREHPLWLEDPVSHGDRRTMYPYLQLGPGILIAKVLNLGPSRISFVWRVLAGLLVGGLLYVVLRQRLRGRLLACCLTLLVLGDIGVVFGKPLFRHALDLTLVLSGSQHLLDGWPRTHALWRLISPALSLPYLLVLFAFWLRLKERATWRRRALAGVSLGLLVPVYFFNWTACFLALGLWFVVDPARRRDLFHVGWIGLAVGAPALISGAMTKASAVPDWLQRSDKFVPIGRTEGLLWPKFAIACTLLCLVWTWRSRRDLLPVAAVALGGLLLLNHQLITGLQIENWHWQYAYGPAIAVLLALLVGGALEGRAWDPRLKVLGVAFVALHFGAAVYLRHNEVGAPTTQRLLSQVRAYEAQRGDQPPLPEGLVGGARAFVEAEVVLGAGRLPVDHASLRFSPVITRETWEERLALDALLRGRDAQAYRREQEQSAKGEFFRAWRGDAAAQETRLLRRLRVFHETRASFGAIVERLNVRAVALEPDARPPAYLARDGWRLQQAGPTWQVWIR